MHVNPPAPSIFPRFLASAGMALLIVGICSGPLSLWETGSGIVLFPASRFAILPALLLLAVALFLARGSRSVFVPNPPGYATGLLWVFFTDWLERSYSLIQGPVMRGEIILFTLISLGLFKFRKLWVFNLLFPIASAILVCTFISESAGRLLLSDDHSVFFFRLNLLKENFPRIPFYYPFWNGGIDARDFFATGALNVFLIFSPLIYLFDLTQSYNYIVTLILFMLLPCSLYCAARLERIPAPGPALCAVASMSFSLLWYRWALSYGTLGFIASCSLLPFNLAACSKILSKERPLTLPFVVLFCLSFSLMLLWAPSGLCFIPSGAIALLGLILYACKKYSFNVFKKKYVRHCAIGLLCLNLPWILVLVSVSNVGKFINSEKPNYQSSYNAAEQKNDAQASESENADSKGFKHKVATRFDAKHSLSLVRDDCGKVNPLYLFLGLCGLFLLPHLESRLVWASTALFLLFVGTVVAPFKPQLELDRMLLILELCLCLPAARSLQMLISRACLKDEPLRYLLLPALCCGFLGAGVLGAAAILHKRTVEQYYFSEPLVSDISQAIINNAGEGRILFSGSILHEISHAHLAPLTLFTSKPLIASSQFHDLWRYRDVIPGDFLNNGDAAIEKYLDLYNVTAIFAHEKKWREYFSQRPQSYEMVWRADRFSLYKRIQFQPSYFVEGSGQLLAQNSHSITLRVEGTEALIKFNYFPFLRSTSCSISGQKMGQQTTLIKLSACQPGTTVTINAAGAISRIREALL